MNQRIGLVSGVVWFKGSGNFTKEDLILSPFLCFFLSGWLCSQTDISLVQLKSCVSSSNHILSALSSDKETF